MQGPTATQTSSPHREAMPYPDAHAPLVGAVNLSKLAGCVDLSGPAAGLGGFDALSGHAVPRQQATQETLVPSKPMSGFLELGGCMENPRKRMGTWPVCGSEAHGDLRSMATAYGL